MGIGENMNDPQDYVVLAHNGGGHPGQWHITYGPDAYSKAQAIAQALAPHWAYVGIRPTGPVIQRHLTSISDVR